MQYENCTTLRGGIVMLFGMGLLVALSAHASTIQPAEWDRQQLLWADFQSHMDGLHQHDPGGRGLCLTGLVQRLRTDWHLMSAEQRATITAALAPSQQDLFESVPESRARPDKSMVSDTCWESRKENRLDTEHFSIQWDGDDISDDDAQAFADSLEESWEIEINELGWRKPSGSDRYLMRVEVERMGGGAGAYTSVDFCDGGYRPYVVASSGSFRQGNWYKTMACHELHHAIQYAYGFAHEFWWWEATATWVEDLVYPYANDWANALYMFSQSPHLGMNASAGNSNDQELFWHTYGMGIWGMYLDQKVGGNEFVRSTWEASESAFCQYCLWMPDVIEDLDEDFDDLYADFLATTAVMDYRDRVMLTDVRRTTTVQTMPADGQAPTYGRPQSLGMNIIEFDADLGKEGKVLEVTLDGASFPDYWVAVLARGTTEVDEMVVFEIDEKGDGMAFIPFEGDAPVHFIVSPINEDAQGYWYDWNNGDDYNYLWEARVVAESDVGIEVDSDESQSVPLGEFSISDSPKKGCSCASAPGVAHTWWLGLGFGLVCLRRRAD